MLGDNCRKTNFGTDKKNTLLASSDLTAGTKGDIAKYPRNKYKLYFNIRNAYEI